VARALSVVGRPLSRRTKVLDVMRSHLQTAVAAPPRPSPSHPDRHGFRPDVEGLRAVAVVLVVLFHCRAGVPGGYVGVDVFFVISGFLITTQLVRELRETGRISLSGFYARRARRILPAATLTTIVTVIAAGVLLSPLAAIRVFGDARAAAVFGANIHFAARDANYFSADLPPSPLQHYWSLSVEEQFYFVWPLLLILSSLVWLGIRHRSTRAAPADARDPAAQSRARPRFRVVIVILAAVATLSFVGSVLQTPKSGTAAYYSMVTRGWELAAGALVALSLPLAARLERRLAGVLTWTGVACIATAAMAFNNSTPYPGDAALLPVAGAVAIIFAGRAAGRRWGAEAVLGTKPFQRVGAWSYSWYLWHWPVLILAPALLGHPLSIMEALAMAVISLVIAVLSFVLVERPIRRLQMFVRHPSLGLAGGAILVASSLAAVAVARPVFTSLNSGPPVARPTLVSHGTPLIAQLSADLRVGVRTERVPSNLDPSLTAAGQDKPLIDKNGCLLMDSAVKSRGCVYGDTASHTSVVLFGDSHAAAWFPAVNWISKHQGWRLVVIAKSGCPAAAVNVVRYGRLFTNCPLWRKDAERQIAALHPALVIVAYSQYLHGDRPLAGVPTGHGSTWLDGTQATFSFLHRAAERAVFITDVPMLTQVAPDCVSGHLSDVRSCTVARDTGIRYPQVTHQELGLAARNQIDSIDSTPWFCTPTRCPVIVDNILMYRDAQHMTPQWSRFLIPLLAHALKPIMQQDLVGQTARGPHASWS
jgi:peptidoglycan/LPS O-acetylase OafA/YrhL